MPLIKDWEMFFACQRSPVRRSELLVMLMSGTVLFVDRAPTECLADILLTAAAARHYHEAEVVSSYDELLDRVRQVWSEPNFTHKTFDSAHLRAANYIAFHGADEFSCPEEDYIPGLVGRWLDSDPPEYFRKGTAR